MRFSSAVVSLWAAVASICGAQQGAPVSEPVASGSASEQSGAVASAGVASAEEELAVAEALGLPGDETLAVADRLSVAEALVGRFPERGEIWGVLGELRLEAGGMDAEALLAFERAVAKQPALPEAWHGIGTIRKRSGDYAGAVEAYKLAMQHGAPLYRELNELAFCLAQQGDLEGAFANWQLAIEESPEKGFLYANALKAAVMLKRWKEGEALFSKCLVAKEFDERGVLLWTDALVARGRGEEAIAGYNRAIELFPANGKFRFYYGATLREMKQEKEAEIEFGQAILLATEANDLQTKNAAQKALFAMQHPKKLEQLIAAEQLLQVEDLHKPKYQDDLKNAKEQMAAIIAENPDFWEPLLMRGVVSRRLGELDLAEQDFKQVLLLAPEQPNATLNLGLIEQDRQNFPVAMEYARKALKIAPRDPLIVTNGIFILINGGACDEATVETRRAADVLPQEILDAITSALQGGCPEPNQ